MTYIDPNRLRSNIASELGRDGVPRDVASAVAENFYRTLLYNNPHWFEPEKVDLLEFVETRMGDTGELFFSPKLIKAVNGILRYYKANHKDHESYPRDDVDKGYYAQSYRDLYEIAQLWEDHPDFKKIPTAVPFVQA